MLSILSADVVGATMKMVSSEAERSQPATGSDSSTGRAGMMTPDTPERTACSRRTVSVFTFDRIHVLVATAGQADEDAAAWTHLTSQDAGVVQGVRGLQRGHDPFEAGAELEGGDRFLVSHRHVLDSF